MNLRKASRQRTFLILGFLGLLMGTAVTAGTDISASYLMRLRECRVSIVLLFGVVFLTLSTAAHAVMIQKWNLFFCLVFARFFTAGGGLGALIGAFGSSAWLIQPMYQCSEWASLILLSVYGLKWCREPFLKRDFYTCLIIAAVVAVFDFCAVCPFLAAV